MGLLQVYQKLDWLGIPHWPATLGSRTWNRSMSRGRWIIIVCLCFLWELLHTWKKKKKTKFIYRERLYIYYLVLLFIFLKGNIIIKRIKNQREIRRNKTKQKINKKIKKNKKKNQITKPNQIKKNKNQSLHHARLLSFVCVSSSLWTGRWKLSREVSSIDRVCSCLLPDLHTFVHYTCPYSP